MPVQSDEPVPVRGGAPRSDPALVPTDTVRAIPGGTDSGLIPVGSPAPPFCLRDAAGRTHSLAAHRGSTVILYFYPKDGSAACSAQAVDFESKRRSLRQKGTVILAISPDSARAHAAFLDRHSLGFPLLIDERTPDGTPVTCARYGVWQSKRLYGRTYMGVVRTTYLIDPNGDVSHRFDAVRVPGHLDAVLAALGIAPSVSRRASVPKRGRRSRSDA